MNTSTNIHGVTGFSFAKYRFGTGDEKPFYALKLIVTARTGRNTRSPCSPRTTN